MEKLRNNPHVAQMLRRRILQRNNSGAIVEMLSRLTDVELISVYLQDAERGREHAAERAAKRGAL
ncbi:MAG: hypothetical protein ABSC71_20450 [Candidatus Acidiferrales bacterium]|jgi:hypothetical protein